MKKAIQNPSEEPSKPAYKRIWQLAVKHRLAILGAIGIAAVAVAIFAYYRTHKKGIWIAAVTIKKSQTGPVTDELSITLTDVKERSDPPGFVVMATVSYTGLPDMKIRNASVGYVVTYPKEHGYTIELLKADSESAKFSITKDP